jgi:tRNA G18 (ribose-2'-O)-methylase SpoU
MSAEPEGDPRLLPYRDVRDADLRGAHGLFLVESARCVARFLRACASGPWKPVSVLAAPQHLPLLAPLAARAGCPLIEAPLEWIAAHSGYRFHHGALALGRHTEGPGLPSLLTSLPAGPATLVIADGVVHVDNVGALFRNAACLGASAIALGPGCADPLGRKSIRISMGRVFGVPFTGVSDAAEAVRAARAAGFECIALEQAAGSVPLQVWRPAPRVAIVIGAEGRGVAPELLAACDRCVEIASSPDPLAGELDGPPSLNVSTALALVLHELRRGH